MVGKSPVSSQGKITLDKALLKRLGVKPGMIAYQWIVNGRLEILFSDPPEQKSQAGVFYREGAPPGPMTGEELEQAVMEAVAEKWRLLEQEGR